MRNLRFEENHIHSTYSDGSSSLSELLEFNQTNDKLDLTFSDHVDRKTTWFPRYVAELRQRRRQYRDFRIRIGCEVKIDDRTGTLNATPRILKQAEIVLGSVHFFQGIHTLDRKALLRQEFALTKRLVKIPGIDVLAHPFSMSQRFYEMDPPQAYIRALFDLCVRHGVQFEYNAKHALGNTRAFITQKLKDPKNWKHVSFGSDVHKSAREIGDAAFQLATPVTVLVTGSGTGIAQSIMKALRLSKVPTRIVAVEHDPFTAGQFRADVAYTVPLAKERGYIAELIRICRRERVELILVGTDLELETIADNRQKIERATGARIIVSPSTTIGIANDKWRTAQFLTRHGFSAPDSCLPRDVEPFVQKHRFPLVVKPRVGARSIGFSIVRDRDALRARLASLEKPIIQEYLANDDEEYTCAVFFVRGRSYGAITMKRWLRNGDTYKAVIRHDPDIERFVLSVGRHLNIHGPCNFQLRRKGKKLKVFEVNCRFSGTTGTQSFVGFNIVNALLQHYFFNRRLTTLSFRPAVMMRYWNELFTDPKQLATLRNRGVLTNPRSELNEW